MLQLPTEDDIGGHGADSVVSHVHVHEGSPPKGAAVARLVGLMYAEDGYAESEKDGDERSKSLNPRERY